MNWSRETVHGIEESHYRPTMNRKKDKLYIANALFARTNIEFRNACTRAGVKITGRQASKFRMKKGLAWNEGRK